MPKSIIYIKYTVLSILLFGLCSATNAQVFSPDIENYSIEKYNADNQNWGVDVDKDGVVYVANNKGLLIYNGQSWSLHKLPNKAIVRSVFFDDGKIYTGSYQEFGFWEKDKFGNYRYTSLTSSIAKDYKFKNEQFWQILKYKSHIIFRSYASSVYVYDGENINYIENSSDIRDMVVYKGKLIAGSYNNGLLEYKSGKFVSSTFTTANGDLLSSINNVCSLGDKLFVYDFKNGGFIYNSNELISLPKTINNVLQKYVINKVLFINKTKLAFGTIKNGVIVYDIETKDIQYINKEKGLNNNTVLGIKYHNGNLWTVLDNGIGKINLDSPFKYFNDLSGILGTVYDVSYFNDKYYLASNTGLYSFTNTDELELISGTEGHIWDLSILDNELFCGHNSGSYIVENNSIKPLDLTAGVYGYTKIPHKEKMYIQSTYAGISLLQKENSKWNVTKIENVSFMVNKIVFESDFIIWVSHPYKGFYRVELNKDYTKAINISYYGNHKYFKQYKTRIYKIDDKVVFYNSNNWFQYFKKGDSIGLFDKFKAYQMNHLIKKDAGGFWFIDEVNSKSFKYVNTNLKEILQINLPEIKRRLVFEYEKVIAKNDSVRIFNLNDGYAIFNLNKLNNKIIKTGISKLSKFYSRKKQFSINDSIFKISYNDAKYLTIEFFTPNIYENSYSYTLSGKVKQNDILKNGKLILQNLRYGNYILSLKTDNSNFRNTKVKNLHIIVLPPWYLSNIMRLIYVLFIISVVYIARRVNKIRIRKKQITLKKQYIRDTQKKIRRIEKENLLKEIQSKKKELMNSTSSIIRKNESIMVLTNELKRLVEVSPNKFRTTKVLNFSKKQIDSNNDWKIFESNFNELNENFLKQLVIKCPRLTTKDLKLCAYIRTGLLSKEIAPLMGISIRGVELHRYRLRKKLKINSNENLFNILRLF